MGRNALAYAGAVALIVLLTARMTTMAIIYVIDGRASGAPALAAIGWSMATFGPLALSASIWLGQRHFKARWLLHTLFIPCAILLSDAGSSMLFAAARVPDDDSVEGYALATGTLLLALTLLIHLGALISSGIAAVTRQDRGG